MEFTQILILSVIAGVITAFKHESLFKRASLNSQSLMVEDKSVEDFVAAL